MGFDHKGPDEFDVVPLAPLSLPKDYKKTPTGEQHAHQEPTPTEGSSAIKATDKNPLPTSEEKSASVSSITKDSKNSEKDIKTSKTDPKSSKTNESPHNLEIENNTIGTLAHESFEATDILIGTKSTHPTKLDPSAIQLILEDPEEKVKKLEKKSTAPQTKEDVPSKLKTEELEKNVKALEEKSTTLQTKKDVPPKLKNEVVPEPEEVQPPIQAPTKATPQQDANNIQIIVDTPTEIQEEPEEEPIPQKGSKVRAKSISVLEKAPTPVLDEMEAEETSDRGDEVSYELVDPGKQEKPGKHRWISVHSDPLLPSQELRVLAQSDIVVEALPKSEAPVPAPVVTPVQSKNPPLVQTQPPAKKATPLYRARKHPRKRLQRPRRWIVKKKIIVQKSRKKPHRAQISHPRRHGKIIKSRKKR